jgi:hypothetical protein
MAMSRRRSRKERNTDSEAPPQPETAAGPTTETVSMIRLTTHAGEVSAGATPDDEMAALDAGWDDVAS